MSGKNLVFLLLFFLLEMSTIHPLFGQETTQGTPNEWASPAKVWTDSLWKDIGNSDDWRFAALSTKVWRYYLVYTLDKEGTGNLSAYTSIVATAPTCGFDTYNWITRICTTYLRGGYSYRLKGYARVGLKWSLDGDILKLTYSPKSTVTSSMEATLASTFEDCTDYGGYRQQLIAESKEDMKTNPELAEHKETAETYLQIILWLCHAETDYFKVFSISDTKMVVAPIYFNNGEATLGDVIELKVRTP